MTEQTDQPGAESENGALSSDYTPAESDSMLSITFHGNTARVAGANFRRCDAMQLYAAGWWLQRHADKMMTLAEQREAERMAAEQEAAGIAKPAQMGGIILPRSLRGGE